MLDDITQEQEDFIKKALKEMLSEIGGELTHGISCRLNSHVVRNGPFLKESPQMTHEKVDSVVKDVMKKMIDSI